MLLGNRSAASNEWTLPLHLAGAPGRRALDFWSGIAANASSGALHPRSPRDTDVAREQRVPAQAVGLSRRHDPAGVCANVGRFVVSLGESFSPRESIGRRLFAGGRAPTRTSVRRRPCTSAPALASARRCMPKSPTPHLFVARFP